MKSSKPSKLEATNPFYVESKKFDFTAKKPINSLRKLETELHTEELKKHFDQIDRLVTQNSYMNMNPVQSSGSGLIVSS